MLRRRIPDEVKIAVGRACGWRCHICGDGYVPADPWRYDHIRSVKHRGATEAHNLGLAHESCNLIKSKDSWLV